MPISVGWTKRSPCAAATDAGAEPTMTIERSLTMAEPLKQGEKYRCPKDECGCEIEVTKGADNCPAENPQPPKCCCGCEMVKV